MKKVYYFKLFLILCAFIAVSCSSDNSNNPEIADKVDNVTVIGYFPAMNSEGDDSLFFNMYDNIDDEKAKGVTFVNYMALSTAEVVNDNNTKVSFITGAGHIDHSEGKYSEQEKTFPILDFNNVKRWQITNNSIKEIENAGLSCYTKAYFPEDNITENCIDMGKPEVISDLLVKSIQENQSDRYILVFFSHGGGSILGIGGDGYLADIKPQDIAEAMELVRQKLQNPDFKFDIIVQISCLMSNAEWVHSLSKYTNYFVGSESSQPFVSWQVADLIKELAKGDYTAEKAYTAVLDSFISRSYNNVDNNTKNILSADINAIDTSKMEAVSSSLDNLFTKLESDYNQNPVKVRSNIFLSGKNAVIYDLGQADLYTFAERLNQQNEYFNIDYTQEVEQLQKSIKDAVLDNRALVIYEGEGGLSSSLDPVYSEKFGEISSISFAPKYRAFMEKISKEINEAYKNPIMDNTTTVDAEGSINFKLATNIPVTSIMLEARSKSLSPYENIHIATIAQIPLNTPMECTDSTQKDLLCYDVTVNQPKNNKIITLNGNPVRLQYQYSNNTYSGSLDEVYFKTTVQSDYEEGSLFTQVVYFDIYIKYNLKTQQAEITEIRKYNASAPVVRIDNTIFKKATKLTIPAYMAEDVAEENMVNGKAALSANNEAGTIPTYEITLDHSKPWGGLYVTAENFEAAPGREIDYRFKADHIFTNKSRWTDTSGTIYGKWTKIP